MQETGPALPAPGTLVRYRQTTSRWYLAIVLDAKSNAIEIELFWGEQTKVPTDRVQPFTEFMAERSKSLFMDRSQLCQRFFGEDLLRLREGRLRKMQSVLRKHGCLFSPGDWPSSDTRIYIWADRSVVSPALKQVDLELATLLPRWLDPQKMPPNSRDPLGLQAHAERVANKLLPGLTVNTTRIGYYGFLCWAIDFVNTLGNLLRACLVGKWSIDWSGPWFSVSLCITGRRMAAAALSGSEYGQRRVAVRIVDDATVCTARGTRFSRQRSVENRRNSLAVGWPSRLLLRDFIRPISFRVSRSNAVCRSPSARCHDVRYLGGGPSGRHT